jgi:hypothetical protein
LPNRNGIYDVHNAWRQTGELKMNVRQASLKNFIARTESPIITVMGRFTLYPGDEVETGNPISLVIRRDGHDYRIAWEIISDLPIMTGDSSGSMTI